MKKLYILLLFVILAYSVNFVDAWSDNGSLYQNIDGCNFLNTTGGTYTLNVSLVPTIDACIQIKNNSITFDGNNKFVSNNTYKSNFVWARDVNNLTIKNLNSSINSTSTNLIYLEKVNNSIIINSFINSSEVAIDLINCKNLTIFNNSIITSQFCSIKMTGTNLTNISDSNMSVMLGGSANINITANSNNNNMYNLNLTQGTNVPGLFIMNSVNNTMNYSFLNATTNTFIFKNSANNNTIMNTVVLPRTQYLITTTGASINNRFINVSYPNSGANNPSDTSNYSKMWWYQVKTNDSNGGIISNANISAYNNNNLLEFGNITTDASGYSNLIPITEFVDNNSGGYYFYNNYSINASYLGFTPSHYINISIYTNDVGIYNNYFDYFTFSIIAPQITILNPVNNSNTFNISQFINFTVIDPYLQYCWYSNNFGASNSSPFVYQNISGVTWNQNWNNITIFANNTAGLENNSEVSFFVDSIAPNFTIYSPTNLTTYTTTNRTINISVSDFGVGLNSCWYSNDSSPNTSTTCNSIFYLNQSIGIHNLTYCANDTLNNINCTFLTYQVSTTAPAINLIFPANNQWLNYQNPNLLYSVQDPQGFGILNCSIFDNISGSWQSIYNNTVVQLGGNAFVYSYQLTNVLMGTYHWNVLCYNLLGQLNWALINNTFSIDIIKPFVIIDNINTTINLQTFTFLANASDNMAVPTCSYSIYNSTNNIDGLNYNIPFTCNTTTTATASGFGSYILSVTATDLAGNTNQTNLSFVTQQSTNNIPAGGGGANPENKVVYLGNLTWSITTDSDTNAYDLQMTELATRQKYLYFVNKGPEDIFLKLSCTGNLCEYLNYTNSTIKVPAGSNIRTQVPIDIAIPKGATNSTYLGNIIAIDQNNHAAVLTLKVSLSGLGYPAIVLDKLLSAKYFGKIPIPYALIFVVILAVIALFLNYVVLFKLKNKVVFSFIIAFIISAVIVYFIP